MVLFTKEARLLIEVSKEKNAESSRIDGPITTGSTERYIEEDIFHFNSKKAGFGAYLDATTTLHRIYIRDGK